MSTLLSIEAPKRNEEGADVVFVRCIGRRKVRVKACGGPDGWHQWGAETSVLGDNVAAIEAWADGMRSAYEAG